MQGRGMMFPEKNMDQLQRKWTVRENGRSEKMDGPRVVGLRMGGLKIAMIFKQGPFYR